MLEVYDQHVLQLMRLQSKLLIPRKLRFKRGCCELVWLPWLLSLSAYVIPLVQEALQRNESELWIGLQASWPVALLSSSI